MLILPDFKHEGGTVFWEQVIAEAIYEDANAAIRMK